MRRGAAVLGAVILLLPASMRAQQPGAAPAAAVRSVTLSADASVRRAPDRAVISLAVETQAATARAAAQQNAQHMDAVVRALKQAEIPAANIRTSRYELNPEYQYTQPGPNRPGEQKLVGYRATNMVEVTVDSIARVGTLIDAAIAAGANRATGIHYQLRDPDTARREALKLAVASARQDAQAVAEAAGERLGELLQISTSGSIQPPPMPMFAARAAEGAAAASTPVEPGELQVSASVNVVYRLLDLPPQR